MGGGKMMLNDSDRAVTRFIAFGFAALWLAMAPSHLSAGMHHPAMWLPIVALPVACLALLRVNASTFSTSPSVLRSVYCLAIVLGILGTGLHLYSTVSKLSGAVPWAVLIRLMHYPPVYAPVAILALGVLGLLTMRETAFADLAWPHTAVTSTSEASNEV